MSTKTPKSLSRRVTEKKAKEWLLDWKAGTPIASIAKETKFNRRTVAKHVKRAQQELGMEEAKSFIVQSAVAKHHEELCAVAETLQEGLSVPPTGIEPGSENRRRLLRALHQHIPSSALWDGLERWNQLVVEYAAGLKTLRDKAVKESARAGLSDALGDSFDAAVEILWAEIKQLIHDGSLTPRPYRLERDEVGVGMYRFPAKGEAQLLIDKLEAARAGVQDWPEVTLQAKLHKAAAELREVVAEELATVILRHVVPGTCRYCPDSPMPHSRRGAVPDPEWLSAPHIAISDGPQRLYELKLVNPHPPLRQEFDPRN